MKAASHDPRLDPLLHASTECFLRVSRLANARSPVLLGDANPRADYPPNTESRVILLHKAILVLSLCYPEVPSKVLEMNRHISVYMNPSQPDGFPPTTVGEETGNNTAGTSDINQTSSGMAVLGMDSGRMVDTSGADEHESVVIVQEEPKKGKRKVRREREVAQGEKLAQPLLDATHSQEETNWW